MATSPTQRCLADLRKQGYIAAVVEKWNPHAKVRHDLFGFADIIYLTGSSIVAVQCTSGSNHATRRAKILACEHILSWLRSGGLVEIWSYAKTGKRGERKLWICRKESIVLEDFHDQPAAA